MAFVTVLIAHVAIMALNIIEAIREVYVIRMKNPNLPDYEDLNKKEHIYSGAYYAALVVLMGVVGVHLTGFSLPAVAFVLSFVVNRRIFFDFVLKAMRHRRLRDIEGTHFFDKMARRIFGPTGGIIELIILFAVQTTLVFITLKM